MTVRSKSSAKCIGRNKPQGCGHRISWPRLAYRWNEPDARIVDAIRRMTAEKGHAPTRREIAAELGIGTQTVQDHVATMLGVGLLGQTANSPRTLRINDDAVRRAEAALRVHATLLGESCGVPESVVAPAREWATERN